MFCVTVKCDGFRETTWPEALEDVRHEFLDRPWHQLVDVKWAGDTLLLVVLNDYDSNGEALADELWDTVAAYAPDTSGYRVAIVSVEVTDGTAA